MNFQFEDVVVARPWPFLPAWIHDLLLCSCRRQNVRVGSVVWVVYMVPFASIELISERSWKWHGLSILDTKSRSN